MNKARARQAAIALIVIANLLLWAIPSNVVEMVARQRHVLLGRYTVDRLVLLLCLLPVSALALFLLTASEQQRKKRIFATVALAMSLTLSLCVLDVAARLRPQKVFYVIENDFVRRMPNLVTQAAYDDLPECARSYPDAPRGYAERVDWTFTSDSRGYRNAKALEQAQVVLLGDSFAEGTKVTDAGVWPVLLADQTGRSVYNLGMSGSDPADYLATLERYGVALSPKIVLCLIYEGNDFRGSGQLKSAFDPPALGKRIKKFFKASPIRNAFKELLIKLCGPINAAGSFRRQAVVSWLPVAVKGRHYAFAPKRVIELYRTQQEAADSPGFKTVVLALEAMRALCRKTQAELIVLYAPNKAHLALSLAADRLPAAQVRDFINLRRKKLIKSHRDLPPPDKFIPELQSFLETTEAALAAHCAKDKLPFFSLTPLLRGAMAAGQQVYYTYDQHWTPLGNRLVAARVARFLKSR